MNPMQSKSIRSGLSCRFPAAPAAYSTRACPRTLALAALCLFALPGVSRADTVQDWTVTGTVDWSTDRTVDRYFTVGITSSDGILNQTGGTLTSTYGGVLIGQVMRQGGVTATYNMSGAAQFNSGTAGVLLLNQAQDSAAAGTWSLTDAASATIGTLSFGQAGQAVGSRYVLLSGAASLNATSLAFNNTGTTAGNMNYISFTTGSTATFTVGDKSFSDYQALVTAGNIRVDGEVQTDFSKFQVVGHTLSLSTGGPTPPHLVITSVSPASPSAGTGFDVTVEAQDESDAPVPLAEATEVTLTRKTGTGTLGGTTSGTITKGTSSVTISGVTYTKAESGVVLTASSGSLAAGDSTPFSVVPGPPAKLAFGVQPSDTSTGVAISPAVTVLVQDENGNIVTGDASSVTIDSSTTAFTPGSVLTVSAVDGVATFDLIEPTTDGSGITLAASDGLLTGATSNPFTVGADTVQDWTVTGTVNRSSSRTVTRYFMVGITSSDGILNQTGGTITSTYGGVLIGQVLSGGVSASYNMSGAAQFNSGTSGVLLGNSIQSNAVATWILADTASATIGALWFGQAGQAAGSRYVLLSGAASLNATSLAFNNTGTSAGNMNYISFASGSAATLTVTDTHDYAALVASGNIRVNGALADMSQFQESGDTLSPAVAGTDYSTWAGTNVGGQPANQDYNHDGIQNGIAYFMNATGVATNPGLDSSNTVTWPNGGNIPDSAYGTRFVVQTSTDLVNWTPVPNSGSDANLSNTGGSVSYTLPPGAVGGKSFVRLMVRPN